VAISGFNSDLSPIGVSGGTYDDFGLKSNSVTVSLTGLFANLNRGDIIVARIIDPYSDLGPSGVPRGTYTFDNTVSIEITGVEGSGAAGALSVTGDVNYALSTTALSSGLGTIIGAIPIDVTPVAVSGTGAQGSLTVTTAANVTPTGVEGTGALGDLVIQGAVVIDPVEGTGAPGTLSVVGDANVTPTGAEGTGTLGTVTPLVDSVVRRWSVLRRLVR
jgi:hypothetical protein